MTPTTVSPINDAPVSRVHRHLDDRGPFWVAVCPCPWASPEVTDPEDAERARANHDMRHADELEAAS